ncbi:MAG: LPS export ABC transporter periplasmic protein LptC [Sphingobacteriales bacterium]|nr:MAG: LPS export ABC transporter periplasmic protein LptC [Sphingobacteriales bacterium]
MNRHFKNITQCYTRILLPGFVFLTVLGTAACKNDPKEIDRLVSKSNMQQDIAHDVTIIFSKNGKARARLFATEFVRNEIAKPPFTDIKKGMKMEFFDDSLHVESTLTAKYARYYEKQGNILIRDSIVVVNKKGEKLQTQELVYNQGIKKFYTEKFVRITTTTQVMFGDGLEANEDFTWYEIKHPKGIIQVDKAELPD